MVLCSLYNVIACSFSQKIEEAAEKGELNELVLLVIWTRLDLARRDVCSHTDIFNLSECGSFKLFIYGD